MGLFALLVLFALLNACVGYIAAAALGYAPPSLAAAWRALSGEIVARPASQPEASIGSLEEIAADAAEQFFEEELDEQLDESLTIEPYDDSLALADSQQVDPDAPENWHLEEKYVETSILKLNIAMMKSGLRATDIDTQLRAIRGRTDAETIRRCLALLREDCETYLTEQSEAAEKFRSRIGELGELASLGEEIEMLNMQQASQIETTLSNLEHMDFESDLEAANARLLEELKNLRIARHTLRDSQEIAFLTIARYENRLDKVEKRMYNDPLTKLRNRIGLETTLWQWWEEGRPKNRPMSAALLDLDAFGEINKQYGARVGDAILVRIAELIQKRLGNSDMAARYAGQRFLVMFVDTNPRAAIKNAEFLRQAIGRITFRHGDEQFHITASVAVTEVHADDGQECLFQRLEKTLAASRGSGPNHTFAHDGRKAELVEAPNLGAEYIDIEV